MPFIVLLKRFVRIPVQQPVNSRSARATEQLNKPDTPLDEAQHLKLAKRSPVFAPTSSS
jgi:hypothetical protein